MVINSPLDIWAPQKRAEEILDSLDNIQNNDKTILFTNLESKLEINNTEINVKFNNCLWVRQSIPEPAGIEKNGRLIMFMEGCTFSKDISISDNLSFNKDDELDLDAIQKILYEKGIRYLQFDSKQEHVQSDKPSIPVEVWPIRYLEVLDSSITDEDDKNVQLYNVNGKLTLKFYESKELGYLIDQRDFSGLVVFNNKIEVLIKPTIKDQEQIEKDKINGISSYTMVNLDNVEKRLLELGYNVQTKEFFQGNELDCLKSK